MKLEATNESILQSKDWVMSHSENIKIIVQIISECLKDAKTFQKKLPILYLCNDIFFYGLKLRSKNETSDVFSSAFQPILKDLIVDACKGEQQQNIDKVSELLTLWGKSNIFDDRLLNDIADDLKKIPQARKRLWDLETSDVNPPKKANNED